VRTVAALSVAGAVPAVIGGVVFWAAAGGTSFTHALASGLWLAATVLFLGMLVTTSKSLWRRTAIAIPEGWMFLAAAVVLTAAGAAIDVAGA
jgi:hypothetical protein